MVYKYSILPMRWQDRIVPAIWLIAVQNVLNIEKPGGKMARGIPYFHKGVSVDFIYNHCGKKSIGIDMKKNGSRELILKLAKVCDVVTENFRPGVMKEFGLTYADFQAVNPSIIMCSISGWGQEGPPCGTDGC